MDTCGAANYPPQVPELRDTEQVGVFMFLDVFYQDCPGETWPIFEGTDKIMYDWR